MEENQEPTLQKVEVEETVKGTLRFGKRGLNNPTPVWATLIAHWFLYLSSAATTIMTTVDLSGFGVTDKMKLNVIAIFSIINILTHVGKQALGVEASAANQ